jgi:hypothetical protein
MIVGFYLGNNVRFEDLDPSAQEYPFYKGVEQYIKQPHNPISVTALTRCLRQR